MIKKLIAGAMIVSSLALSINVEAKETKIEVSELINKSFTREEKYLPLREIAEKFGYDVKWNMEENLVSLNKDPICLTVYLDSNVCKINKEVVTLENKPVILNDGITFMPERFFTDLMYVRKEESEALILSDIKYLENNKTVEAKVGQKLVAVLKVNSNLGYKWTQNEKDILKGENKKSFKVNNSSNSANIEYFEFNAEKIGEYEIELICNETSENKEMLKANYKVIIR